MEEYSGNMDNYELYLLQKQQRNKEPSKKYVVKYRRTTNHKIPKSPLRIPQTDLKPSSKPMKKSCPSMWNIGRTVPKFSHLRYPPATPKSHDTRFQKPINISLENFAIYVTEP